MATAVWRGARSLSELLERSPQRFEALQAARLLDALHGRVRYRGSLGSGFAPSEIEGLDLRGPAPELTVGMLTLAGAFGPLPRPLAELVAAAARRKDVAARDFLDLFNHRLIELLIQLRRTPRPAAEPGAPEATRTGEWLFALLGLGTPGLATERRLLGRHRGLPFLASLLARRPVGTHAVERLIAQHFSVPVRIEPLRGAWLHLEAEQATALGSSGRNRELGRSAVVGRRVWEQAAGLRISLGPLPARCLCGFLPDGAAWGGLRALLAFALDGAFAIEIVLLPVAEPNNAARLGSAAARLGWTAWLGAGSPAPVQLRLPAGAVA